MIRINSIKRTMTFGFHICIQYVFAIKEHSFLNIIWDLTASEQRTWLHLSETEKGQALTVRKSFKKCAKYVIKYQK